MPQEKPPEEFHVVDRRRFSETGERREDVPEEAAVPEGTPAKSAPQPSSPSPAQAAPPGPASAPPRREAPQAPPRQPSAAAQQAATSYEASGIGMGKVGFDRVIMTYAQTAMLQLGVLAADPSQPLEPDLYGARETIDAIALIEEKTRGNLTPQEQHMLENTLFELRMAWLEIDRRVRARG